MNRKNIIFIITFWVLLFTIAARANPDYPEGLSSKSENRHPSSLTDSIVHHGKTETPKVIQLSGNAMNFTANESSEVKLQLTLDGDTYKGTIDWDNVTLYGSAEVESETITNLISGFITVSFKGSFDCGGLGGWPENTESDFSATLHLSPDGGAFGSYLIQGQGRLPMQVGDFNFTEDTF